jgi:hypothetical protein
MMTTIDTAAGEVMVATIGEPRAIAEDWGTYYEVPVRLMLPGQRGVNGVVSLDSDARPMGDSRETWLSLRLRAVIDLVEESEQSGVLSAIAAVAGLRVEEVVS